MIITLLKLKTNQQVLSIALFIMFFFGSCQKKSHETNWYSAQELLSKGEFTELIHHMDSVKASTLLHSKKWMLADSFKQIAKRIMIDFRYSEEQINTQLAEKIGKFSEDDKRKWESNKLLEYKIIDGEKRYFKAAISNLARKLDQVESTSINNPRSNFCLEHTAKVIDQTKENGQLVLPVKFNVTYKITLDADAVPDGEVVKCWMPWPKETHGRQTDLEIIKTSESKYIISPDSFAQRSIYMEKAAKAGMETIFEVLFSYQSYAQYFDPDKMEIQAYEKAAENYKRYTKEDKPHVVFSKKIKKLADSIIGDEKDPYEIVRKLSYWIDRNIPWASALEYGIIPCIPEYSIDNEKGDCGMQTLLFISMARYKGIPVKWQSGWMMHPTGVNLHDWCEVYYEGVGWVPTDISFNLQNSDNKKYKEFYITGIDSYRMIVNDAIGTELYPPKKFLRSEPWDFQRGELEWSEGNLYFNQWDYNLSLNKSDDIN